MYNSAAYCCAIYLYCQRHRRQCGGNNSPACLFCCGGISVGIYLLITHHQIWREVGVIVGRDFRATQRKGDIVVVGENQAWGERLSHADSENRIGLCQHLRRCDNVERCSG